MAEGKFFWLKLKKDFFKRHDIRILEAMPGGKEYVLFYLKLLVESIDHDGNLRFSDDVPYTPEMLATITNTDPETADNALGALFDLGMIDFLDDKTYVVKDVMNMVGASETDEHTRESGRLRVKAYRERKKTESPSQNDDVTLPKRYSNVTVTLPKQNSNVTCNGEIDIEKELEIEKEKDIKKESIPASAGTRAQKHKYGSYGHVMLTDEEYSKLTSDFGDLADPSITFLDEYIEMKGYKCKSHYLAIRKWVVDAVKERKRKTQKPSQESQHHFENERQIDYEALFGGGIIGNG